MSAKKTKTKAARGRGRPEVLSDAQKLCVAAGRSKFQKGSLRRAVFMAVVDNGGCMRLDALNESFGFDTRTIVGSLVRSGWLELPESAR